jgi:hypothetical protein
MPASWPPASAGSLAAFPGHRTADRTLYRVWRHHLPDGSVRHGPWWFASLPDDPEDGGRFDLAAPMGTCYTAADPVGAVLEALQALLRNLPADELRVRRVAIVAAPQDAPDAADMTATSSVGSHGVTAELWAGPERAKPQAWAAALRRDGWWGLHAGIRHDPSGRLRSYALFGHAGQHPPTVGASWDHTTRSLDDDIELRVALRDFGIEVREPGDLPHADPPSRL